MTEQTRKDFEAACQRYWGDRCPDLTFKDDRYEGGRPALAWAFWQAAILDERERCARVCENLVYALDNDGKQYRREATASKCADAIRQGGEV